MTKMNRRSAIAAGASGLGALSILSSNGLAQQNTTIANRVANSQSKPHFRYCLNTSTIRGQKLPIDKIVTLAGDAGYDGIEPWLGEINRFKESGGKLSDLKKQIFDAGLKVESAIGFANWIVDDEAKRKKGFEQAKRDMEIVRAIGGTRIAAPPAGDNRAVNLDAAAERYAKLLEIGESVGVVPQLELWGFSEPINRLGELIYIAAESGRSDACVLPDVYHIYKGGSDFAGLNMLSGNQIHVFHINDYPSKPSRQKIGDADRVFPGDGVAPLNSIMQTLSRNQFRGALSLELFNRAYWKQEARTVAATGLAKMKKMVDNAFAEKSDQ